MSLKVAAHKNINRNERQREHYGANRYDSKSLLFEKANLGLIQKEIDEPFGIDDDNQPNDTACVDRDLERKFDRRQHAIRTFRACIVPDYRLDSLTKPKERHEKHVGDCDRRAHYADRKIVARKIVTHRQAVKTTVMTKQIILRRL